MSAPWRLTAPKECRPEAPFAHRAYGATFHLRPLTCVSASLTCVRAGLCDTCAHQKIVRSGRGSVFSMCLRHRTDDRFPKYPRIPVERCPGYEKGVSESR